MTGDMLNYAILNGLKPHIASYVMQKAPTTIDDLLSAARVAELTITSTRDTSLHAKVHRLMENWEHSRLCATSVQQRSQSLPCTANLFYNSDLAMSEFDIVTQWLRHAYRGRIFTDACEQFWPDALPAATNDSYGHPWELNPCLLGRSVALTTELRLLLAV